MNKSPNRETDSIIVRTRVANVLVTFFYDRAVVPPILLATINARSRKNRKREKICFIIYIYGESYIFITDVTEKLDEAKRAFLNNITIVRGSKGRLV